MATFSSGILYDLISRNKVLADGLSVRPVSKRLICALLMPVSSSISRRVRSPRAWRSKSPRVSEGFFLALIRIASFILLGLPAYDELLGLGFIQDGCHLLGYLAVELVTLLVLLFSERVNQQKAKVANFLIFGRAINI